MLPYMNPSHIHKNLYSQSCQKSVVKDIVAVQKSRRTLDVYFYLYKHAFMADSSWIGYKNKEEEEINRGIFNE